MKQEAAVAARYLKLIAFSALGAALAACGGGGGGGYGGGGSTTPTATLAVNPQTIALGQSATLTWSSTNSVACDATGGWTGAQTTSGTSDVTPTAAGTVTYTLTCSGATSSTTLTINTPSAYTSTSLVEDLAGGTAATADPLLVNPWGIAYGPTTGIWVANNHSETATIYNGSGRPSPLVVHFAPGAAAAPFDATGIVFNGSTDFAVTAANVTAPALFIFDGEGGTIGGWAPTVDASHEVTMYTATDGAVYKGLAIANNGTGNFLYAADFANGKIDVLNAAFVKQPVTATSFAFADATLPAGYAPFGIQAITKGGTTKIYVSYAKHDTAAPDDEAPGAGLGVVNVFDTNGNFLRHLVVEGGKLNAPWGMTLAPADFGTLSNALLVGNFGDGAINGYDLDTGRYQGAVTNGNGTAFAVPGLWGIAFGNDAANQPHATLFFAAGTNNEVNGRYGRIDLGSTPPALGDPPALTLVVPPGNLSGTVALQANGQNLIAIAKVQFYLNGGTLIGTDTADPFTVQWDTTAVANGNAKIRAVATDVNGNVGSSGVLTVTVANAAAATLTQLQQAVFTPRCSGCHNGSNPAGGALPGSMDLRAGGSFASLVNVASLEQGTLMRIKPGDADNSYLVRKIQGAAGITGAQMPFGGPFLDQATIDQVRSWVTSGAQNN